MIGGYHPLPTTSQDVPHWPRRGPKRDEKDRRWSCWFLSLLGDHIHPIIVQTSKCAKCDISETALLITISKFRKHFSIQTTPQKLGKITSETTFGHSKVVSRPLLRIKRAFSQNPPMAWFWKFRGSFPPPKRTKKSKSWPWYIFFRLDHLLISCVARLIKVSSKSWARTWL